MTDQQLDIILKDIQKPGRYTGGELGSVLKNKNDISIRFAFAFPDTYEIGMSHLGMKILYSLLNEQPDIWCERMFMPWTDMEQSLRTNNTPLFTIESRDPLSVFDIIGFSLQYELSYTNVLAMLNLANIPLISEERNDLHNIVIAGGPCTCNPEPMAGFIDAFFLGEAEESLIEFVGLYKKCKKQGKTKKEFLISAAKIEGVYIPSLYYVNYNDDKTIKSVTSNEKIPVKKRIINDLNTVHFPKQFVVPFIETVHDRTVTELFRGCIRGCRFCQAGMIYRPVREKSFETANGQAKALCESTGYDEVSLMSLSTSDYSELEPLLDNMLDWTNKDYVNISLPSLRIDNFSPQLLEKIKKVRSSGLTFAPEAGSQRLRDVINKNLSEQDILKTCKTAFDGGYSSVKLYFMLGLPTETDEDILAITDLAMKIIEVYYTNENRKKGAKGIQIQISVSVFVPKAFTPFQWHGQDGTERIRQKQDLLLKSIPTKKIRLSWSDPETSKLEAVFARGDRRLSKVLLSAYKKGCKFDGWSELFDYKKWQEAFEECDIDPKFYSDRKRDYNEILPWDHLDYFISKEFLKRENENAKKAETTPNCREKCSVCGVQGCRLPVGAIVNRPQHLHKPTGENRSLPPSD